MPSQGNQHRQTLVLCAAAVGVGLLVTAAANATPVQQPDGTDIPKPPDRTDRPNEPSMQQVLDTAEGAGQIDVTTMVDSEYPPTNSAALNDVDVDAAATPQTFKPQCDLTFEVFSRGADSRNSFGWYNVTGSATEPTTSELIEMIGCSDPVGFTSGPVNFAEHPRWTGGDIGFYIASQVMENGGWDSSCPTPSVHGSLFFSESKYNRGVDGTTDYKYVLIVDSKITPDSFYFGWEDSVYNADWDFNDLLVRVTGIQCKGA